jgi:hypothetical protein
MVRADSLVTLSMPHRCYVVWAASYGRYSVAKVIQFSRVAWDSRGQGVMAVLCQKKGILNKLTKRIAPVCSPNRGIEPRLTRLITHPKMWSESGSS